MKKGLKSLKFCFHLMWSYKKLIIFYFILPIFRIEAQNKAIIKEEFIFTDAPFAQCHASTIVETSNGMVAAWFGGTAEKNKDVEIWLSRRNSNKWSLPESVANGMYEGDRYPCWNPVLYQIPHGTLILYYKVGPDPSAWWGMTKRSFDQGKSWSAPTRLPDPVLGPVKNKPVLLKNGILICPSSSEKKDWKVQMDMTKDFGETWMNPVFVDPESTFEVIQPTILQLPGNLLRILCRSRQGKIMTSVSHDLGNSWSSIRPTELPNPNSGIDAVTLKNGTNVLVFNPVCIPPGKWGGPRTPLAVAVSEDGMHWEKKLILEDQPGEYSYPAIIQTSDGLVHVTYTWKRIRIKHVILDPVLL